MTYANKIKALCCLLGFLCGAEAGMQLQSDKPSTVKTVSLSIPIPQDPPPAWSDREIDCLARTVYGESRNQPFHGQVAVAVVPVNRSLRPQWAADLCSVVRQRGQFAGYWAAPARPWESLAWTLAYSAAYTATFEYLYLPDEYRDWLYFNSRHEKSRFHSGLKLGKTIWDHSFYSGEKK